ncbi:MAG: AraC family transcriptional regulator ligand-binding domain-containing protein [Acidobacteriota bacterium]
MRSNSFVIHPGWRLMCRDVGLHPANVLRRADLPDDLLSRPGATLSTPEYFRFWRAIEQEADDPTIAIRIGASISVEAFDAPIFAALCSPNLNIALHRLSRYKALICPMRLEVDETESVTTLAIEWLDKSEEPPQALTGLELVFFIQLARLATREPIRPLKLTAPVPPEPAGAYTEFLGQRIETGSRLTITFAAADATRPFLTANEAMWEFFEPELRRRLSELDETATVSDRVHAALLELLPSGSSSLQDVAKTLAVSSRTLQRRLRDEGESFRTVLDATREELARHYLTSSTMSGAEISFLLGFEDPNSFFRAFHAWTGETPEQARSAS